MRGDGVGGLEEGAGATDSFLGLGASTGTLKVTVLGDLDIFVRYYSEWVLSMLLKQACR